MFSNHLKGYIMEKLLQSTVTRTVKTVTRVTTTEITTQDDTYEKEYLLKPEWMRDNEETDGDPNEYDNE